jgi:amino acid adenylation domain-containing protein
VLTACFGALLHLYAGQERLRLRITGHPTHDGTAELVATGESTLRILLTGSALTPLPTDGPASVGVRYVPMQAGAAQPLELELELAPITQEGLHLELHYDDRLFDETTAVRMLTHYANLTRDGVAAPDRPLKQLALLDARETRRILTTWNATSVALPFENACLHEAFEEWARRTPEAIAVVQGDRRQSYREIDDAANRLAHRLRGLGVGPEVRVGLFLEHSPELLVAMLGVLKAGGAYVPLDPDSPPARLTTMIEGASCAVLISLRPTAAQLPQAPQGCHTLLLDAEAELLASQPSHKPAAEATPANLCYVIHTSGSTGVPKAIALCHRGVMNNIADLNTRFAVEPGDSVLGLSSASFDMSVYEFIGMTAAGGTLVLADPGRFRDPHHWAALAATHGVTIWNTAPALLELLLEHIERHGDEGGSPIRDLRLIMLAGDWIPVGLPARVRKHAPDHRFISLGGATEASIYSTIYEVRETDPAWTSIPYGRPMANQRTYILNEDLRPVPPGVAGDLYLAGTGLAREYLDQPALTAERFLNWSFGEVADERLYRTGDLARYDAEGLIELLGRADLQVKINGLRIELAEVEAALRSHPSVTEAVVMTRADVSASSVLVGYVVARGVPVEEEEIRAYLGDRLPAYMVPSAVVRLEELPLSHNGKVDRKALPAPRRRTAWGEQGDEAGESPQSPWEKRIARVWCEVLGITSIGRDDSFFTLGGTSMLALRATAIDPAIMWTDVYRHPTLRELTQHLEETAGPADV